MFPLRAGSDSRHLTGILLPERAGHFNPHVRLVPLVERYTLRQTITLLMPRRLEQHPHLVTLAEECRALQPLASSPSRTLRHVPQNEGTYL